jgi:TRAP-type C4-dicarboxylate transport system permease small subunit
LLGWGLANFALAAWNLHCPNLCLPSSWDYTSIFIGGVQTTVIFVFCFFFLMTDIPERQEFVLWIESLGPFAEPLL